MQFSHAIDALLSGAKTRTSRLVKREHYANRGEGGEVLRVNSRPTGTTLYAVGYSYAVQTGREQKTVARIRITRIQQLDVRTADADWALREGCASVNDFLEVWCGMHDRGLGIYLDGKPGKATGYRYYGGRTLRWTSISGDKLVSGLLCHRPSERYQAWVLDFTRVQS